MEYPDPSVCSMTIQDTASTPSSLFDPSTPQGSEHLNADYFSESRLYLQTTEPRHPLFRFINLLSIALILLRQRKDQHQIQPGIVKISQRIDIFSLRYIVWGACQGSVSNFEADISQALDGLEESRHEKNLKTKKAIIVCPHLWDVSSGFHSMTKDSHYQRCAVFMRIGATIVFALACEYVRWCTLVISACPILPPALDRQTVSCHVLYDGSDSCRPL